MTHQQKAEFAEIFLNDMKPFWSEINIVGILSNVDWDMGCSFVYNVEEEVLCKLITTKGWKYEKPKGFFPRIITKFWWAPSNRYFYLVLTKGINLEQYQKSLQFTEKGDSN